MSCLSASHMCSPSYAHPSVTAEKSVLCVDALSVCAEVHRVALTAFVSMTPIET